MIPFNICNITIHATNFVELKKVFENLLNSKTKPQLITTFNLDFLRIAHIDLDFRNICKNALYNLPDGFGITSLVKLKYKSKIKRITGNDVFPLLLNLAKKNGNKVAIIGGTDNVSNIVRQKIQLDFNLTKDKLLCLSPPYNFETNKKQNEFILKKVSSFAPDIVFAAFGCPRQEKWLFENMNKFGSRINIGIGATLDYYSGVKKRSPIFFQNIGLEWLWRLTNEPGRLFNRYVMKDIPFYFRIRNKILKER